MPSLPSDQVIPRYETLRADILAAQPCLDHGWGLFLHRGMLAWSQSHNPQAGGPPRPSRELGKHPLPAGLNRSATIAELSNTVTASASASNPGSTSQSPSAQAICVDLEPPFQDHYLI